MTDRGRDHKTDRQKSELPPLSEQPTFRSPLPLSSPNENPTTEPTRKAALDRLFPESQRVSFPCNVAIPTEDPKYLQLCLEAFRCESKIRDALRSALASGDESKARSARGTIDAAPVTRNIMTRDDAFTELREYIPAGIYLGSRHFEAPNLRAVLETAIRSIFYALTQDPDATLLLQCKEWARIQAQARNLIAQTSWIELTAKQCHWTMPEGFLARITQLLEHNLCAALQNRNGHWEMRPNDQEAYDRWFSQTSVLAAGSVRTGQLTGDKSNRQNSSPTARASDSLITISLGDALDHWSAHLQQTPTGNFRVKLPTDGEDCQWLFRRVIVDSFNKTPAYINEMEQLGGEPLAPFITELSVDFADVASLEIQQISTGCRRFIKALKENREWRSPDKAQNVLLRLENVPYYERENLLRDLFSDDSMTVKFEDGDLCVVFTIPPPRHSN